MKPNGKARQARQPTPDDEAYQACLDAAVEWMIRDVLSQMDHTRRLGSLNRIDLRRMAEHALFGYVLERCKWDAKFATQGTLSDVGFAIPI